MVANFHIHDPINTKENALAVSSIPIYTNIAKMNPYQKFSNITEMVYDKADTSTNNIVQPAMYKSKYQIDHYGIKTPKT